MSQKFKANDFLRESSSRTVVHVHNLKVGEVDVDMHSATYHVYCTGCDYTEKLWRQLDGEKAIFGIKKSFPTLEAIMSYIEKRMEF